MSIFRPSRVSSRVTKCLAHGASFMIPAFLLAQSDATDTPKDRFELTPLLVTAAASPKEASDYVTLASALDREALFAASSSNLGEAVSSLVGVQQTGFAPGAGRPVIRGFGGPRVQMLQDGLALIDVSAMSDDHAVSDNVALGSRVEVLRGPATLLYGGNAIGGVVNLIQETAPRALPTGPIEGQVALSYDGASEGWEGALRSTVGFGPLAFRIGLARNQRNDYAIPDFTPPEDHDHAPDEGENHEGEESLTRLPNTFSNRDSLAIGLSGFTARDGRISASFELLDSLYGVPGHHHEEGDDDEGEDHEHEEAAVRIDLLSRRGTLGFDLPLSGAGVFERVKSDFAYTDYEHRELEGDEIGTRFTREAWEWRNEWTHAPLLDYEGVIGWQWEQSDFTADGEEAFTPPSTTRRLGLFWAVEKPGRQWTWQHGVRFEYQQVKVDVDRPDYSDWSTSASSGFVWKLRPDYTLGVQASLSQRHPNVTELFADGPHLATGAYEIGDPDLGVETALGLDLTLRHEGTLFDWTAATYLYRFDDYIYESPTGEEHDELPVQVFRQDDAVVVGFELENTVHLWEGPESSGHLLLGFDWTRLENLATDDALPRNPPARVRATFHVTRGMFGLDATIRHSVEQDFLAPNETATGGYTMLDLALTAEGTWLDRPFTAFVSLKNLTDELAFNHLTYGKEEKPLVGRSLAIGLRWQY